jgi:hypothetical protein
MLVFEVYCITPVFDSYIDYHIDTHIDNREDNYIDIFKVQDVQGEGALKFNRIALLVRAITMLHSLSSVFGTRYSFMTFLSINSQ